jgi:hypothetical protein
MENRQDVNGRQALRAISEKEDRQFGPILWPLAPRQQEQAVGVAKLLRRARNK